MKPVTDSVRNKDPFFFRENDSVRIKGRGTKRERKLETIEKRRKKKSNEKNKKKVQKEHRTDRKESN